MKGIIFDIRSFSVHDGPGIRTSFFLKGCPLRCSWCHNPESHQTTPETHQKRYRMGDAEFMHEELIGREVDADEIIERAKADRPFFDALGGITLSGGEPLMQPEFVKAVLLAAQKENIHTALDTSGYSHPAVFQETVKNAQLVLFDLKIFDRDKHKQHTGVDNTLIMQNFDWLCSQSLEVIVRLPLIEHITDTAQNLEAIRQLLNDCQIQRLDLLPFHHYARSKYKNLGIPFTHERLGAYPADKLKDIMHFFSHTVKTISIGG